MGNLIVTMCSAACVLIYAPVLLVAFRSIVTRQATITSTAAVGGKMLHFTGAAAMIFGIGQILSAGASFYGVYLAVTNSNLLYLFAGALIGALAAVGGTWLARKAQMEEAQVLVGSQQRGDAPNMIVVDDANRDAFISESGQGNEHDTPPIAQ
ncbi:MAG: hypothetical protein CUN56_08215 [Phototrophicales bacterium]|nr:MAG: hypothetical protein CUN56_08215 [Phototrophicales bacterium]